MANSDKNILITPSTGSTTAEPTIKFTGSDNLPVTLRVLSTGTVSFEGTSGQLFSISDGMSGTIFSVNDISGIPSIEVLDTGLIKLAQYNGDVVVGSSAALLNGSSVSAEFSVQTSAATKPAMILRGATSQAANLLEVQNVGGTVVGQISPAGVLRVTGSTYTPFLQDVSGTSNAYIQMNGSTVLATTAVTTNIPLTVKGAASQTANLQEWQSSAAGILARVSSTGDIATTQKMITGAGSPFTAAQFGVISGAASRVGAIIQGAASQTANLQEWQDSSSNILARVDYLGNIIAPARLYVGVGATGVASTKLPVVVDNASFVGMVIRGASSQTANLQEWQESNTGVPSFVNNVGQLRIRSFANSYSTSTALAAAAGFAGEIPITVRGAASQTADLQQWQNSGGSVVTKVTADGTFTGLQVATNNFYSRLREENSGGMLRMVRQTAATTNPGSNTGALYFRDGTTAGTLKLVTRAGTAGVETTLIDNIDQTGTDTSLLGVKFIDGGSA